MFYLFLVYLFNLFYLVSFIYFFNLFYLLPTDSRRRAEMFYLFYRSPLRLIARPPPGNRRVSGFHVPMDFVLTPISEPTQVAVVEKSRNMPQRLEPQ